MLLLYCFGICGLQNVIVLYAANCVFNSYSISYFIYIYIYKYLLLGCGFIYIHNVCVSNPELKYGWKSSASALTRDLFRRIKVFTTSIV